MDVEKEYGLSSGRPRLLLCDGWNIMIAQNSVANILDSNTMQIGMYLSTMNMIRTFVDKFKPSKVVFALDGPNAGQMRRSIYPDYKAGRRVKAKTSSVTLKEDDDDYTKYTSQGAFTFQVERIYNFLQHLPVSVVIVPYCEGDDLIAHLALKNKEEFETIIVSGDKDYCQLIQPGINVYNWREKLLYNEKVFLEKYQILPQNYIFMKIMLGDSSDEVKGVKGIGKKTFPVFIPMLSEKIYKDVGELVEGTKTMDVENLPTRERNAVKGLWTEETMVNMTLLNRVMKLDENNLKLHHIDMMKLQLEEQENKFCAKISVSVMMLKHQFNKLYNGFNNDKWINPFLFIKSKIKLKV